MMNLRELIIDQIKCGGWLDYNFTLQENWGHKDRARYLEYLHGLDDADLLSAYDRVHRAEDNLD